MDRTLVHIFILFSIFTCLWMIHCMIRKMLLNNAGEGQRFLLRYLGPFGPFYDTEVVAHILEKTSGQPDNESGRVCKL